MPSMSIQTCTLTGCKTRHPLKNGPKSTQSFLRHAAGRQGSTVSAKSKSANRRSAVERLEESKANYVKSESVLDSKQEFKNSSHLHVSTGPHLDLLLKAPPKISQDDYMLSSSLSIDVNISCCNRFSTKSPVHTRIRAKSHSEVHRNLSFASRESNPRIGNLVDIESQLKRLLTTSSKENVADSTENVVSGSPAQLVPDIYNKPMPEVPKVRRGYSDPTHKGYLTEVENQYCIHKSLPNLSPLCRIVPKHFPAEDPVRSCNFNSITHDTHSHSPSPPVVKEVDHSKLLQSTSRRFSNDTGTLHLTAYIPQQTAQHQRHAVSRSKSDVSHRYMKRNSEFFPRKGSSSTAAEIERFFDMMGLDTTVWHHITSPSSVSSPPCFFDSVSSVDSNDRSTADSEESIPGVCKDGLRNYDLRGHDTFETSIVEKNARVIKWLYNCRKATLQKS